MEKGDVYFRREPRTGKFFAFQIVEVNVESATSITLDYFAVRPPTQADLHSMAPFAHNTRCADEKYVRSEAPIKKFPKDAVFLGNKPLSGVMSGSFYMVWPDGHELGQWTTITLSDENMAEIILPANCERLNLRGKFHPRLKVEAPGNGAWLEVNIDPQPSGTVPNLGLPLLQWLNLRSVDNLDLASVPEFYPRLQELRLFGKPGNVVNINSLSTLPELRKLVVYDIFGFTAAEFPTPESWPALEQLTMNGIPREAGKEIRKRFRGKADDVSIRTLRP